MYTIYSFCCQVFMDFNKPENWDKGGSYERTLLGCIMALNPCPRGSEVPCEFFTENAADLTTVDLHKTIMFIWQVRLIQ